MHKSEMNGQTVLAYDSFSPDRLFEKGLRNFRVVLGDANLKVDLPFGVQTHEIESISVHEDYSPEDR